MEAFTQLGVKSWLTKQLDNIGLNCPTPVQKNCIPPILQGKDVIGCAKTGSGKTLAFALPVLQKLNEDPYGIFALVLTPTRELAYQIADQFRIIGKSTGLRDCVIVGGMDMVKQGIELAQQPHIVVATPGRLADHLDRHHDFSLKKIKFLIIDEADRMLEGNFDDQLKNVFAALPAKKQTLLFSATMTDTLEKMRNLVMIDPFFYEAPAEVATADRLDQKYLLIPSYVKDGYLTHIVLKFRKENPKASCIIFTDTCKSCQILCMTFSELGFQTVALHSMMSQKERISALTRFRSNNVRILVATDVASRGLDIPAVQLVVNHNVPQIAKDYIHRVGRTARAGRGGRALTLVAPQDEKYLYSIEALINAKLEEEPVNDNEVCKILTQVNVTKREQEIKLDETDFDEKRLINKRKRLIMEGKDPEEEERKRQKRISQRKKEAKKRWHESLKFKVEPADE